MISLIQRGWQLQARCRYRNERKIQPEKNTKQHEQHFSIPSPRPKHYNRQPPPLTLMRKHWELQTMIWYWFLRSLGPHVNCRLLISISCYNHRAFCSDSELKWPKNCRGLAILAIVCRLQITQHSPLARPCVLFLFICKCVYTIIATNQT